MQETGLPPLLARKISSTPFNSYGIANGSDNVLNVAGVGNGDYRLDDVYLGFRFGLSGEQQYGWAKVSFIANFDTQISQLVIQEWAYETQAGQGINVGDGATAVIPEPTSASLGLLALGAVGLRRWRKSSS